MINAQSSEIYLTRKRRVVTLLFDGPSIFEYIVIYILYS